MNAIDICIDDDLGWKKRYLVIHIACTGWCIVIDRSIPSTSTITFYEYFSSLIHCHVCEQMLIHLSIWGSKLSISALSVTMSLTFWTLMRITCIRIDFVHLERWLWINLETAHCYDNRMLNLEVVLMRLAQCDALVSTGARVVSLQKCKFMTWHDYRPPTLSCHRWFSSLSWQLH